MFIADIILVIHFCIVIFITSGFLLIPIGYKINWALPKNRRLRMLHLGLMMFVTLETILGVTCPLTSIENELRGILETETFIRHWIKKIIYWNFLAGIGGGGCFLCVCLCPNYCIGLSPLPNSNHIFHTEPEIFVL